MTMKKVPTIKSAGKEEQVAKARKMQFREAMQQMREELMAAGGNLNRNIKKFPSTPTVTKTP